MLWYPEQTMKMDDLSIIVDTFLRPSCVVGDLGSLVCEQPCPITPIGINLQS